MEITTFEQLEEVRVKHELFLINPFSNGNQSKVNIEQITILSIHHDDRFTGRARDYYFTDMLSNCKYVFTLQSEAESKLNEVRKGLHADEVKEHHDSYREMEHHFGMSY